MEDSLQKIKALIGKMPQFPKGDAKLNRVLADFATCHKIVDAIEVICNQGIKQKEVRDEKK
jgi:hypothetical protein